MSVEISKSLCIVLIAAIAVLSPSALPAAEGDDAASSKHSWQEKVASELPLLGHRNWIVVADSAYPAQSRPGIETVYIGGDQTAAVKEVLDLVDRAKHVRGVIHLDAELKAVPEADAPGADRFRRQLKTLLDDRPVRSDLHESVIETLDDAARTFRVLILKTDCTIPYTSVFIQLDCQYWSADAEQRMREAMGEPTGQ